MMNPLVSRFQNSLSALNRCFGAEVMKNMGPQITSTQMYMLSYIRKSGACRITELADQLDVKPSAVTVMIDRLVKAGYVTRGHDPSDRRVILAELTDEGRDIMNVAVQKGQAIIEGYMSALTEDERRIVTELLEKMLVAARGASSGADVEPVKPDQ